MNALNGAEGSVTSHVDQPRLSHVTHHQETNEHQQSEYRAKVNAFVTSTMFRLLGDRQSLLVALAVHWIDHQVGLPSTPVTTEDAPASSPGAAALAQASAPEGSIPLG